MPLRQGRKCGARFPERLAAIVSIGLRIAARLYACVKGGGGDVKERQHVAYAEATWLVEINLGRFRTTPRR